MIVIVDYGMGNMGSIQNMLRKVGAEALISRDHEAIEQADKLIIPGVGSFDHGMNNLAHYNLIPLLTRKAISDKVPILGICLGMQLFTNKSEEGQLPGLGWINATTVKLPEDLLNSRYRVPHMGWNTLQYMNGPIFSGLEGDSRFYFVHSYHVQCNVSEDIAAKAFYGVEFTSAVQRDNIIGVQFHPEKSHRFGMQLMNNFVELN